MTNENGTPKGCRGVGLWRDALILAAWLCAVPPTQGGADKASGWQGTGVC